RTTLMSPSPPIWAVVVDSSQAVNSLESFGKTLPATFHTLTRLSVLAVAINRPSGENPAIKTRLLCRPIDTNDRLTTRHNRTVPSSLADASKFPSGEKLTYLTSLR